MANFVVFINECDVNHIETYDQLYELGRSNPNTLHAGMISFTDPNNEGDYLVRVAWRISNIIPLLSTPIGAAIDIIEKYEGLEDNPEILIVENVPIFHEGAIEMAKRTTSKKQVVATPVMSERITVASVKKATTIESSYITMIQRCAHALLPFTQKNIVIHNTLYTSMPKLPNEDKLHILFGITPNSWRNQFKISGNIAELQYVLPIPRYKKTSLERCIEFNTDRNICPLQVINENVIRVLLFPLSNGVASSAAWNNFIVNSLESKINSAFEQAGAILQSGNFTADTTSDLKKELVSSSKHLVSEIKSRAKEINNAIAEAEATIALMYNQLHSTNTIISMYDTASKSIDKISEEMLQNISNIPLVDRVKDLEVLNSIKYLVVETKDIYYTDNRTGLTHHAGRYIIYAPLTDISLSHLKIYNLCHTFKGYGDYCDHPHINKGTPCFGNIGGTISALLTSKEYVGLISVLIEFLSSVNTSDPAGRSAHHWPVVNENLKYAKGYEFLATCTNGNGCSRCKVVPSSCIIHLQSGDRRVSKRPNPQFVLKSTLKSKENTNEQES